jgi:hypothetical protein
VVCRGEITSIQMLILNKSRVNIDLILESIKQDKKAKG